MEKGLKEEVRRYGETDIEKMEESISEINLWGRSLFHALEWLIVFFRKAKKKKNEGGMLELECTECSILQKCNVLWIHNKY